MECRWCRDKTERPFTAEWWRLLATPEPRWTDWFTFVADHAQAEGCDISPWKIVRVEGYSQLYWEITS